MQNKLMPCFLLFACSINPIEHQNTAPSQESPTAKLAQAILTGLPDDIKKLDDPALRVYLRIQLAEYLWETSPEQAESLASEAFVDLQSNKDMFSIRISDMLRTELFALVRTKSPALASRLSAEADRKEEKERDQIDVAYAMLGNEKGAAQSVAIVRDSLRSGGDPGARLFFFLFKLSQEDPDKLTPLLSDIMAQVETQKVNISLDTLILLRSFYLDKEVPATLTARYLSVLINFIEPLQYRPDDVQPINLYRVLTELMPSIEATSPALSNKARVILSNIASRMPVDVVDRLAIEQRIKRSDDALGVIDLETNSTKDDSFKRDLMARGSELALSNGDLKKAVDLAVGSYSEGETSLWLDQFLLDVVSRACEKKNIEMARYAEEKIKPLPMRATAMQRIGLFFFESGDTYMARDSLNQAGKLLHSSATSADKAIGFLKLASSYMKVDKFRSMETIQASIKTIEAIPRPRLEDKPDSPARRDYSESLLTVSINLIPSFQSLVDIDAVGAWGLANGIQLRELRATALFGVFLSSASTKPGAQSK